MINKILLGASEMHYCIGCDRLDIRTAVIVGYMEGYDVILCNDCLMASVALLPSAEAMPDQAEDAARYRYLCEYMEWPDSVEAAFDCSPKSVIDSAIDAAIAARA